MSAPKPIPIPIPTKNPVTAAQMVGLTRGWRPAVAATATGTGTEATATVKNFKNREKIFC
jgi:hypothetical protein